MLRQQRKGDDGFDWRAFLRAASCRDLIEQLRFERVRDWHLAGADLLRSGADKAELAVAEAFGAVFVYRADRRAEDAASHGTPLVDVATAGRGVKRGAGSVVGKVFKEGLVGFRRAERAGPEIAGKGRTVLSQPDAGAVLDCGGQRGVCDPKIGHAFAEARGIEGVDGEGSMAALRATDAAGEEVSGAASGIGDRGVDNLDQLRVARGKRHGGRIIRQG